jgi:RNA polymerase subunit RPABC4/transcription elongation factor Spt4
MANEKKCIDCGADLAPDSNVCPKCGAEQPVKWMVWMVYVLLGLFIVGAIYRMIVP